MTPEENRQLLFLLYKKFDELRELLKEKEKGKEKHSSFILECMENILYKIKDVGDFVKDEINKQQRRKK